MMLTVDCLLNFILWFFSRIQLKFNSKHYNLLMKILVAKKCSRCTLIEIVQQ